MAQSSNLKFVGTDAFEDFYQLQQVEKGSKLQRLPGGSLLLKEKIMREAEVRMAGLIVKLSAALTYAVANAQVLDASILKVASFINHMVDVELMEACGEELAERLEGTQPTKARP